jgi:hypothetical protein
MSEKRHPKHESPSLISGQQFSSSGSLTSPVVRIFVRVLDGRSGSVFWKGCCSQV